MKVYLVHEGYDNLRDYDSHIEWDIIDKIFDSMEKADAYIKSIPLPTEKELYDGTVIEAMIATEDMEQVEDGEWDGLGYDRIAYIEFDEYDKAIYFWNIEEREVK